MAQLERGKLCPLLKKDCVGLQCSWYTQVRGTHPQTGQEVDEWACAITWTPVLLIETAKEVRQGAAAAESMRNDLVGAVAATLKSHVVMGALLRAPGAPNMPTLENKENG